MEFLFLLFDLGIYIIVLYVGRCGEDIDIVFVEVLFVFDLDYIYDNSVCVGDILFI